MPRRSEFFKNVVLGTLAAALHLPHRSDMKGFQRVGEPGTSSARRRYRFVGVEHELGQSVAAKKLRIRRRSGSLLHSRRDKSRPLKIKNKSRTCNDPSAPYCHFLGSYSAHSNRGGAILFIRSSIGDLAAPSQS
jgi:hypothetical protein